ncbi:MAG: sialate O-acetylesterase [Verrucomicrobiota bacterium JB022]|nr:sialate O-acetylesterase [Verrucomicrobiota bacterium JB022]
MLPTLRSLFITGLLAASAYAEVRLPSIFGDHMVIQRDSELVVWGRAKALEKVTVRPSWTDEIFTYDTPSNGQWRVTIPTPSAGGPHRLVVEGYNRIELNDILAGEVWLASGQSNMEWTAMSGIEQRDEAIATADYPQIRLFTAQQATAEHRQYDVDGAWQVTTPDSMRYFSAVAYFFGRELHEELQVPVGLISSSWGGTPAEVWTVPEKIESDPALLQAAEALEPVPWGPVARGVAYHAMIEPLIPYRIRGTLWYQGEGNVGHAETYDELMEALVGGWREQWGYDFPFFWAQIAPWKGYGEYPSGAELRDAQRRALRIPESGMVVTHDIGDLDDIHPRNKHDVGHRFALLALDQVYGKDVVSSGPLYRQMRVRRDAIEVEFDYADGLVETGALTDFQIAGEDRIFHPAKATITDRDTVLVSSPEVPSPVAVRFGWSNATNPTLFNAAGLPASTFRTDDWPPPAAE